MKSKAKILQIPPADNGFTLLEMLVTLALFSFISMILYQAVVNQWSSTRRVSAAVDRVNQMTLREQLVRDTLRSMTAQWPDALGGSFRGNNEQLTGLTVRPADTGPRRLAATALGFETTSSGAVALVLRQDGRGTEVLTNLTDVGLQYIDHAGGQHDVWPQEKNPGNGFFRDANFYGPPELPQAILVDFSVQDVPFTWVIYLENQNALPFRMNEAQPEGQLP